MLKAILFDMDGVLVDSEPIHFKSNCITLEKYCNITLEYEYYKQFIGSTIAYMWKRVVDDFHIVEYTADDLLKLNDAALQELVEKDGYPPIPGAAECVREWKQAGYLLAVASSSKREKILQNIKRLGIADCFDRIVSGMELEHPKPSPDIFLEAAKLLEVKPEECLVIEDSGNGVKAAVSAGMACLGFLNPNSGEQDLSGADYLFESFSSLDESFLCMVHNHHFGEP